MANQETKVDNSTSTLELFPETCPYSVYRKDRTLNASYPQGYFANAHHKIGK